MSDERRKFRRYTVNWPCRLLLPNKRVEKATLKDISAGGVSIEFANIIANGEPLGLEFFGDNGMKKVRVRVKVIVRHHTLLASGSATLGMQYAELTREAGHDINNILQKLQDSGG
jgi:c-di-GMP-binding flagellar brake protein YcgR